eukprot:jgi/Botrbrau1/14313/Bobra.0287s0006.1
MDVCRHPRTKLKPLLWVVPLLWTFSITRAWDLEDSSTFSAFPAQEHHSIPGHQATKRVPNSGTAPSLSAASEVRRNTVAVAFTKQITEDDSLIPLSTAVSGASSPLTDAHLLTQRLAVEGKTQDLLRDLGMGPELDLLVGEADQTELTGSDNRPEPQVGYASEQSEGQRTKERAATGGGAGGGRNKWREAGLALLDHLESIPVSPLQGRALHQVVSQAGSCGIYILDIADIATELGLQRCNVDDVVADHITQVPFLRSFAEEKGYAKESHMFTANAGPWFLYETLLQSPQRVLEPELANIVYVHDYCYKLWWLAHVHSQRTPEQEQAPGYILLQLYRHMIQMPLWKKHNGRNFVFFQSHTGFATYEVAGPYESFLCNELGGSLHFVNTRSVRYRCPKYNESDFVIVPPSVHFRELVKYRKWEAQEMKGMKSASARARLRARNVLVFFRGKCTPTTFAWDNNKPNRGKQVRLETMRALSSAGPSVRIECTGDKHELKEEHAKQITHDEQVMLYFKSVFCLVIPGDSQTSRRLPEAVLTGCIPVFYGPPFHTIPLGDDLDYRKFSLAFNLTEPQVWNKNLRVSWTLDMKERANERGPTDSRFWIPDVPYLYSWANQVPNLQAMLDVLRMVPSAEVKKLQAGLRAVRSRFLYMPLPSTASSISKAPTLSTLLIDHMCNRAKALGAEYGNP